VLLSSPVLDRFFAFVTDASNFGLLIIPWLLYLLVRGGREGRGRADTRDAHVARDRQAAPRRVLTFRLRC